MSAIMASNACDLVSVILEAVDLGNGFFGGLLHACDLVDICIPAIFVVFEL